MRTKIDRITAITFLLLVFLLANIRTLVFWTLFPNADSLNGDAWREVWLWGLALVLMFYLLHVSGNINSYLVAWRMEPLLAGFILFCLVSGAWSISPMTTVQRSLSLLCASLAAVYLGSRHSLQGVIRILFWVSTVFVLSSFLLVVLQPSLGRDFNPPYDGAWRGIFWHKNHLGNLLPFFCIVFLFQMIQWWKSRSIIRSFLAGMVYTLSLFMLWKSDSASGYVVAFILHGLFVLIPLWLRFSGKMARVHYLVVLAILVMVSIAVLVNLDLVFGLLGRSSSLTGRLPLWQYLLSDVHLQRPWLGYGFGSLWADEAFRVQTSRLLGWTYQVLISDNGFIDLLLDTGIVGLLLFLMLYLKFLIRAIRFALTNKNLLSFFIPLFMVYACLANLSYSLFLEIELQTWVIMIALYFLMHRKAVSEGA